MCLRSGIEGDDVVIFPECSGLRKFVNRAGQAQFCQIDPAQLVGIRMDVDQQKDLMVCLLWITQHGHRAAFTDWIQYEDASILASLLSMFSLALTLFDYATAHTRIVALKIFFTGSAERVSR